MTEPAPPWFAIRDLGDDTFLLSEPGHVNSYLVVGDDRALLFDTGTGIADIGSVVQALTDKPIVVVNSHHHFDHRGGNQHLVDAVDVLCHPAGVDCYGAVPTEELVAYRVAATSMVRTYNDFRALDKVKFFLSPDDLIMRELPDLTGWSIPATPPRATVEHGAVIDLGGRALTVQHTPGHVSDSLCLWEPATGLLFCGDTLLTTTYWAHLPDSDVAAFASSLAVLAALPVRTAFVGHNLVPAVGPDFIATVAATFCELAAHPDSGVVVDGPHGTPVRRTDGPGFAVLTTLAE